MKRLATILSAAGILLSSIAFATDSDKVNARVRAAFQNDFSKASEVNWEKISDFYFASFLVDNVEVNAAYTEEGELVGTSRPIESSQLPINVTLALNKKYERYVISKRALELTFEGSTSYYVTAANDRQALKLKCSANGDIAIERKMKRK
jgi:hypothetical protein